MAYEQKEYGGCLPLEKTSTGNNPYLNYNKMELNCGRAGIYISMLSYGADTLWVPYYMCPTVGEYIKVRGLKVKNYNIEDNYLPSILSLRTNEMILWPDYYGCMYKSIRNKVINRYGEQLILDCTQALFSMPEDKRPYYIYSIRKFIGVPEGSYLIKQGVELGKNQMKRFSNRYDWTYLEDSSHNGSNMAYQRYKMNEEKMKLEESYMEEKTRSYLSKVDWEYIKEKRKQNFNYLHRELSRINRLDVNYETEYPFMYPLYVKSNHLRSHLINNKLYVSQWWKSVLVDRETSMHEKDLARYIVPLPIDQRYDESDMRDISKIILAMVN